MPGAQSLLQASRLVQQERYLQALALLEQRIDALAGQAIPDDPPLPSSTTESLATYLSHHQDSQFAASLGATQELVCLCAAATQLCALTLGQGARAAAFMRRAAAEASRYPEPFDEMLASGDEYFSMMWYFYLLDDQAEALRCAYRISSRYPGLAYEHVCQEILEAKDWDEKRCRYISFYLLFPNEDPSIVVEHTLLNNPVSTESYDAAVRDSVLTSLERGRHGKDNDWYWMQTLLMLVDDVCDLAGLLPMECLGEQDQAALRDALLDPLSRHVAYQQRDGFKTDYQSSAAYALKKLKAPEFASLPAMERVRRAQAGEARPQDTRQALPADAEKGPAYFTSTVFENDRVFLSSSFRDMLAERDWLLTYTFPEVDRHLREFGVRLTPVDLRGIKLDGSEEGYDKECFKYCLSEIDRCDSLVGLIGSRYGWVMYDENTTDPAMAAIVRRVASEHGVPLADMAGKSITHIEMMYGLRALERSRCYFYLRKLDYTNGADEEALRRVGYADGHVREDRARQDMIMGAYGIQRIAPENEPGANVQYYSARFDGQHIFGVEGLGESIRTKLIHDHVFKRSAKHREAWYTRLLSFWSDAAHQSIVHPRLDELLDLWERERFVYLTGPEGVGKTVLLAQLWETLRQRGELVVPVEALLEAECDSFEAMADYAAKIEARLRTDLPRGSRLTKKVCIILDGVERVVGRGRRITLLDSFCEQYQDQVRVLVCAQEGSLAVPASFAHMRLGEPPAPAAELVRNVAWRAGKRLDQDTIARVAELGQAADDNPLYLDLLTRRLLYLLQDEFDEDYLQWLAGLERRLDGTVASVAALTQERVLKGVGEQDRALAAGVIEQLRESRQGCLGLGELASVLRGVGLLPQEDPLGRGSDRYVEEQGKRLMRVLSLLNPLLLYDYNHKAVTLAHLSFVGEGRHADAQAEAIRKEQGPAEADADVMLPLSYLFGAAVAAVLAGTLVPWPYDPAHVWQTLVQVVALALLFGPLGMLRDEWKNAAVPSMADLVDPLLNGVGTVLAAVMPLALLAGDSLPAGLAGAAAGLIGAYPYLLLLLLGLHCLLRSVAGRDGAAPLPAALALLVLAAAGAGVAQAAFGLALPLPVPLLPASLGLLALLYLLMWARARTRARASGDGGGK